MVSNYISTEGLQQLAQQQVMNAPLGSLASPSPFQREVKQMSYGVKPEKKVKKKKVGVSIAIADFAQEKAENLKAKLSLEKLTLQTNKKLIEDNKKKMRVMEDKVVNLEQKYNSLTQVKRSELVSKYRKIITLLKKSPEIEKFETDIDKRVIITTKPLFVQKTTWDKPREIGRFQIRIDFSKTEISGGGVQILNITQRYQSYDNPTINNTSPCWGNIGPDITNEFQTQDLYELVLDLIDYIRSPNESSGFLGKNGDKTLGWEQFFEGATKQPENFSFYKYDQLQKSKNVKGVVVGGSTLEWTLDNPTERFAQEYGQYVRFTNEVGMTTNVAVSPQAAGVLQEAVEHRREIHNDGESRDMHEEMARRLRERNISEDNYQVMRVFRDFGMTERAAYYFMGLLNEEPIRSGEVVTRCEVRASGGQISVFFHIENSRQIQNMTVTTAPQPDDQIRVLRYFANERDFKPRFLDRLRHAGVIQFLMPNRLSTHTHQTTEARETSIREQTVRQTRETLESLSLNSINNRILPPYEG